MKTDEKKPVAWMVSETFEGHGCVIFHHHGMAARRIGANQLDCDFDEVEIRRVPRFDCWANDGKVPLKALMADGWWWECAYCSNHVIAEINQEFVIDGDSVYCNEKCKSANMKNGA